MLALARLAARLDGWLHDPAPPERLAGLRIAIGGFITIYLAANIAEFARVANRPAVQFDPVGIARVLAAPLPSFAVWSLFAVALVSGVIFTAGLWTRVSGPVFALAVLGWTSYHSSWGQLLHFEHLFTLHIMILAGAPVGDAWTLGSASRAGAGGQPSSRYGWPIRLLAIVTALTYFLAGVAKLRLSGTAWFDPATLANHIGYSATRMDTIGGPTPPLSRFVLQNQWLIVPLACVALAIELGAPLALLGRRLRNLWVGAALCFHAGTGATMLVFFGYRGLGVALLPLFAIEQIPPAASRLLPRWRGTSRRART